ncbi:MAG: hypothetical protein JXR83_14450 [Deltaproteobacteria bacterium]|nr:hypothetical protein [Deltaproteobacteria bacterium]
MSWRLLANALVAVLAMAGCRGPAGTSLGPAPAPDLAAEVATLDAAIGAGTIEQAGLLRRAELALMLDRNGARTADLLARASRLGPLPADGALLACHLAYRERRYGDIERACGDVLERFAGLPQAEEAAALVSAVFDQTGDADARVAGTLWRAREHCRPDGAGSSCVGLALRAARGRLTVAAQHKDVAGYSATVDEIGGLRRWQVCGPIAPDAVDRFRELRQAVRAGTPPAALLRGANCTTREVATAELRPLAYSLPGAHLLRSYWHVPRAGRGVLMAQLPGAAILLVDGRPVMDRDPWAHPSAEMRALALQLEAGWHELAAIVMSSAGYDSVSCYLMDDRGRAAFDTAIAALPPGTALASATPLAGPELASAVLERNLDPAAQPSRAARLIELLTSSVLGDGERARAIALGLTAAVPDSGLAWLLLAEAVPVDLTLTKESRDAQLRRALTRGLELRPGDLLGRYRLALLEFEERPDEALARMRSLVADRPDYPWAQRRLASLLLQRGLTVAAADPLAAALRLAPGESSLGLAADYYQARGADRRARAVREARLELEPTLASDRRVNWLIDAGDLPGALAESERQFGLAPDRGGHGKLFELARAVEGDAGVWRRARARLELFPHDAQAAQWLVRASLGSGDPSQLDAALAVARRALPGDPLWERYRLRAAGEDIDALLRFDVPALIADFEQHQRRHPEIYSGHGRVYLLDAMARVLIPGGGSFSITHQLVKVQSKEAAGDLGEVQIAADADRRVLRVIKADGRSVEPEAAHAGGSISLAGIEVGDLIELRYLQARHPDRIDGAFWERFYFGAAHPIFKSTYHLFGDPDLLQELDLVADDAPPAVREQVGGRAHWSFTAHAVPALRPEPFSGPAAETRPHLTVSRGVDVEYYARRAARHAAWREISNFDIANFARAAVRGRTGERERLEALVRAVLRQVPIPGHGGNPIEVLATGRGDRLPLLRAACLSIGLDARWIGVHRASPLPVVDWEDRNLGEQYLLVRADGRQVPVSLSGSFPRIGELPAPLAGGTAVEIDPARPAALGRTLAIDPGWLQRDPDRYRVDAALDASGALRGNLEATWQPPLGSALRQAMRSAPRQNTEQWIEAWLGELFAGAVLEELQVEDLDDDLAPLRLRIRFAAADFAHPVAGALVVERFLPNLSLSPVVEGATPAAYLRLARRRTALYLRPRHEEMRIRLQLPAGTRPLALPDAIEEQGRHGRYRQHSRTEAGALLVERTIDMPFVRVPPEEYLALRALGERIAGQASTRLVLPFSPETRSRR